MQILEPMLANLTADPDRPHFIDDGMTWTAGAVHEGARRLATGIAAASDRECVGIMVPTSGLFPMALLATWMLGRTAVPMNYLLEPTTLDYIVRDAGVDLVLTESHLAPLADQLTSPVEKLRLDDPAWRGNAPTGETQERGDDHLAALLYTSGTSGDPKGVMLTAGNLAANVRQCTDWVGFTRDDVFLGVLPQFHSFGLTVLTLLPLTLGCRTVYSARFMPKRLLDLMAEHRPTAFVAIPSMYGALLAAKSARADHFSSIQYLVSGGEPLPDAVSAGFRERFDAVINEGYGLTETGPVTNWCRPDEYRPHSVGKSLPDIEEKIVDRHGQPLPANTDGEVCIKGPNIMRGYHGLEAETAAVFDDEGFFHTGDMGRLDDDGHLYITGRIKEMLIIAGENVFPREIEEVLSQHPSVAACAVIGLHDPSRGEVPLAFVELVEGAPFDEREVRSFCREQLSQFKVPREIRVLEALPRNPTGKIMRRSLSPEMASIVTGAETA